MPRLRWLPLLGVVTTAACGRGDGANPADGSSSDDGTLREDATSSDATDHDESAAGDSGVVDGMVKGDAPTDAGARGSMPGADACVAGSVTFDLRTSSASDAGYCFYWSFPGAPGSVSWVTVRPAEVATSMPIYDPCPAVAACQECTCNGGFGWTLLGDGGAQATWDGTLFVGDGGTCELCGMCGQCFSKSCAAAGEYVARFCAYRQGADGGCGSGSPTACTDVPFAWPVAPDAGPVTGVVGPDPRRGEGAVRSHVERIRLAGQVAARRRPALAQHAGRRARS